MINHLEDTTMSALDPIAESISPTLSTSRINQLPPLVDALLQDEDIRVLQATVQHYLQQIGSELKPDCATLLRGLCTAAMGESTLDRPMEQESEVILATMLDTAHAQELAQQLLGALNLEADESLGKQLVWAALMLELDPLDQQKIGHVAGFDLYGPANWGATYPERQQKLDTFLAQKTAHSDTLLEPPATLASFILYPAIPDFMVKEIPPDLQYGSTTWVNFVHGVALAELQKPGSARAIAYPQLLQLPLALSSEACAADLQIIALLRLMPTLQWATANGVIPYVVNAEYSSEDAHAAMDALDQHLIQTASAIDGVFQQAPDRIAIGNREFVKVMADEAEQMKQELMRPATVGKRIEYSLKNPHPMLRSGVFYLFDLFVSGQMINGLDRFELDIQRGNAGFAEAFIQPKVERLKGIDIPAIFENEFAEYVKQAQAGYAFMIEQLLYRLPAAERARLNRGALKIYVLQGDSQMTVSREQDSDRARHRARQGFIIECWEAQQRVVYEVFPLSGTVTVRTDMYEIDLAPRYEQRPSGSRNIHRVGIELNLDLNAYTTLAFPVSGVVSRTLPSLIASLPANPATPGVQTLTLPRVKSIAMCIANEHLFFDREQAYHYYKHETGSEFVAKQYPPMLRSMAMLIPGLGCINALANDEPAALACTLDLGALLLIPAFKFAAGSVSLALRAGQVGTRATLPAFARLASSTMKSTVIQYQYAMNPLGMWLNARALAKAVYRSGPTVSAFRPRLFTRFKAPQRINQHIGYPLSPRPGQLPSPITGQLGTRLDLIDELEDFLRLHRIAQTAEQLSDLRADIRSGRQVFRYKKIDGSDSLALHDVDENLYVDVFNNGTVYFGRTYNYKTLGTWATPEVGSKVVNLPIEQVQAARLALAPERSAAIRHAIESGIPLPAVKLRRLGDVYSVIDGNHRVDMARQMGLTSIPAIIVD